MSSGPGFKIAELARLSGTSKETIHFYLREGLLRQPQKTGRNMAYYDDTHVEQLALIKRLRSESYLPLNVIKQVLKDGKVPKGTGDLDLSGELIGGKIREEKSEVSRSALLESSGLTAEQLDAFVKAGLLRPRGEGDAATFPWEDARLAVILRKVDADAGEIGIERVIERFSIFERFLEPMVREELSHFFNRVITDSEPRTVLDMLRGGRETIGRYLAVARARRLREEIDALMPAIRASIGDSAPELLFEALPSNPTIAARRRSIEDALREEPRRVEDARTLLEHELLIGHGAEVLADYAKLPPEYQDDRVLRLSVAEARMLTDDLEGSLSMLDGMRGDDWPRDPLVEALWGACALIRLRRNFETLVSSTELIATVTSTFTAFESARNLHVPDLFVRARILLLIGRIAIATPPFLGAQKQGLRDLTKSLQITQKIRQATEHKDLANRYSWGPLQFVEQNAANHIAVLRNGA